MSAAGNRPPPIEQTLLFTYTNDLEEASRFFSGTLGFDRVYVVESCHIFRVTDTSFIGVCDLPGRPTEKAALTISFVANDVEGWHDFLTAKGIEFVKEPHQSDQFGVYSSLFISPHGYRIEILRFNDTEWDTRRV